MLCEHQCFQRSFATGHHLEMAINVNRLTPTTVELMCVCVYTVIVCSVDDETEQIGLLGVSVECLQALQAINREL